MKIFYTNKPFFYCCYQPRLIFILLGNLSFYSCLLYFWWKLAFCCIFNQFLLVFGVQHPNACWKYTTNGYSFCFPTGLILLIYWGRKGHGAVDSTPHRSAIGASALPFFSFLRFSFSILLFSDANCSSHICDRQKKERGELRWPNKDDRIKMTDHLHSVILTILNLPPASKKRGGEEKYIVDY